MEHVEGDIEEGAIGRLRSIDGACGRLRSMDGACGRCHWYAAVYRWSMWQVPLVCCGLWMEHVAGAIGRLRS